MLGLNNLKWTVKFESGPRLGSCFCSYSWPCSRPCSYFCFEMFPKGSVFSHFSWSVVDTVCRLSRAASLFGLTWIHSHADTPVPAVPLITGTKVLVWTGVDTGGLGMTDWLHTRVYGWGDGGQNTNNVITLLSAIKGQIEWQGQKVVTSFETPFSVTSNNDVQPLR